jgi:hypothetical protein
MSQTREPLDRETPPPAPLWVKVTGGIALALLLLVVVLHLSGNSFNMMHGGAMPSMDHSGQQP